MKKTGGYAKLSDILKNGESGNFDVEKKEYKYSGENCSDEKFEEWHRVYKKVYNIIKFSNKVPGNGAQIILAVHLTSLMVFCGVTPKDLFKKDRQKGYTCAFANSIGYSEPSYYDWCSFSCTNWELELIRHKLKGLHGHQIGGEPYTNLTITIEEYED